MPKTHNKPIATIYTTDRNHLFDKGRLILIPGNVPRTPLIKLGVDISRLERNTRRGLNIIHQIFINRNETLIITSTYEGDHPAGSLNYANQAFHIRQPTREPGKVLAICRSELGNDFHVIIESTCWHVEYDPN